VNPGDVFEFNGKFTDRMRRIRVPMPPVDEKKKVVEDVDKDRRSAPSHPPHPHSRTPVRWRRRRFIVSTDDTITLCVMNSSHSRNHELL
jgi:hypothetical protein